MNRMRTWIVFLLAALTLEFPVFAGSGVPGKDQLSISNIQISDERSEIHCETEIEETLEEKEADSLEHALSPDLSAGCLHPEFPQSKRVPCDAVSCFTLAFGWRMPLLI